MRYHRIPDESVRRLPLYLRALLFATHDRESISSGALADVVGVNSWQIRKDFSYFGELGTRGVGYNIEKLKKHIRKILKLDVLHKAVLVGAGKLGSAVLLHRGFSVYGFDITAVFDNDPKKIGRKLGDTVIQSVSSLHTLKRRNIDVGIIAVPGDVAQQTVDALVKTGVKGILNFSPSYISVPKKVKVLTIDIAMDLARLPYYMPRNHGAG